ncbi:MAG TPA: protein kinase [Gemmatimonadales bacterium]|jgi:serine/threonine-protein kinase|nr:protein kinase [Gemmatimonadales bacterium]
MTGSKTCPVCGGTYAAANLFCPLDRAPLVNADPSALLGTVIAERYLLSDLIGEGGMGEVYRAQDVRLQRPAAVKLLRAALLSDLDALRRFSREGMNASCINHPNVVQVYDAGETSAGVPYLAMEFVPGRSLGRILADEGSLPPERAIGLIHQVAAGLDAAHRLGVVHRDLKPDNILLIRDERGGEVAKVADFGISRAVRDASQKVTKTGFVAGTYEFMSPEQVLGGEFDHRSDLYALALMAFLMLAGKLPFPGATAEHSMLMRLTEPPRPLRDMRPEAHWPDAVQGVFDRALARLPEERFASASAFATALAQGFGSEQAVIPGARPGAGRARSRRWVRPAGIASGIALAAVALTGSVVWLLSELSPRPGSGPGIAVDTTEVAQLPPVPVSGGAAAAPRPPAGGPAVADTGRPLAADTGRPLAADTGRPLATDSGRTLAADPAKALTADKAGRVAASPSDPALAESARSAERPDRAAPGTPPATRRGPAERRAAPAPARPATPGEVVPTLPPATSSGTDAPGLLEPFDHILRADLPADSAEAALAVLEGLMPRLRTARDSVDATIYRATALAILGEEDRACGLLDQSWPRATPLQRRKIALWVDRGLCPNAEWRKT